MNQVAERALFVWPLLAAQTVIFGTAIFVAIAPGGRTRPVVGAMLPAWRALAILAVIFSPPFLLVTAANMGGVRMRAALPLLPEVVRETHFGHVWVASFGLTLALAIAAWLPGRGASKAAVLAVIGGALLLLDSFSGHAIDRGGVAVAVYFAHEAAASIWLGAIAGLWFAAVRDSTDSRWTAEAAQRVSSVAGVIVIVLILSGAYTAYYSLAGDPHRLIESAYGRVLVDKICAAMIVLMIGAYNRYWLIPHAAEAEAQHTLLRNVGIESILLIGVIGLAALLGNTPPPH
jgi:putative copper resistance protein D